MQQTTLQRKYIWPGWLRLAHWGMALSVLALMATSWLLKWTPSVATAASDYHVIAGAFLMLSLLLRLWLLVTGKEVAGWQALVPTRKSVDAMLKTLQFYITLGNSPMPGWYAHNPLWVPLYGLLFSILVVMSLTGFFMPEHPVALGFYLPAVHKALAPFIWFFVVAHIVAVIMHDAKAKHSDISGMINGYRIFEIKPLEPPAGESGVHKISLDQINIKKKE